MIANTQTIIADRVADPDSLAPHWTRICREAGSTYPSVYLQIGLLGLRRLPGAIERGESPWIAGLAVWAKEQKPTDKEFLRIWRPIKRMHPATPARLRAQVFNVLSQKVFTDADIEPPGWWANDPDFPKVQDKKGHSLSLEPPPPELRESVIQDLRDGASFSDVYERLKTVVERYRRYTDLTADDYFLVRSFCNIGNFLLKTSGEALPARAEFAQQLARDTLRYQPQNPIAWSLWRDSLFSAGSYDAAIALGWETVLRFPNNPLMRNELAEILIALGKLDEARKSLEAAVDAQACNAVTYAILARLHANRGDVASARQAIEFGLSIDEGNAIPTQWLQNLDGGKQLPLVASARNRVVKAVGSSPEDLTLSAVERGGNLRRFRDRLKTQDAALSELKEILEADPTFAYAQILAARHGLWKAAEQGLPPVAAAFEEALADEDTVRLKALTEQLPRLASLILLARAILGDEAAADEVSKRLLHPDGSEDPREVEILRVRFEPVFKLIDGGLRPIEAIAQSAASLRIAIYDTNEALAAPELMVA